MTTSAGRVLGIDIGGTNIAVAVVDDAGRIITRTRMRTDVSGRDEIVTQLVTSIESLRGRCGDISAAGIGVAGVVNRKTGYVVDSTNLPLGDTDLGRKLSEACGLPVVVDNDVTLATLGEAWYGAAQGVSDVVGIFIGTGIGGGLVLDGELYGGAHGAAGEVGHMLMDPAGPVCPCGRVGCFEALASRTAVERDIGRAVEAGRACSLAEVARSGQRIRSGLIAQALDEGDPVVTEIMAGVARVIGEGAASVANLIDPDMVVLGGGLIEACGGRIMPTILEAARARLIEVPGGPVPIVASQLGNDAGIMGAAAMAQAAVESRRPGGPSAYTPQIEWIGEGEVQINGQRHVEDLVTRADGSMHRRRRKLSRRVHGNPHVVSAEEVEYVCRGNPRPSTVIVGSGTEGRMALGQDACAWLEKQGIRAVCLPSMRAVSEYRVTRGPRALLLHLRD